MYQIPQCNIVPMVPPTLSAVAKFD
uniref:Uncharacterized protein n=1 Tax=Anguilla anguilla TaxID=7936 RepID=A0A0E9Y0A2_ANGAN